MGPLGLVGHGVGKVVKGDGGDDGPLIGVVSHQKLEEGGLSPSVSAHKPQFPVGVDLKGHRVENAVIACRVGKGEIFHFDHRHRRSTPFSGR